MNILVTGGAGFIGSHVVDTYLAAGHKVAVVDNLSTGRRENLNQAARFFEGDITDRSFLQAVMKEWQPEVVNHHAAQVDVRRAVADPLADAELNIRGSLNLLLMAEESGIKRFIYANSGGAGYGDPAPADIPCTEETPLHPISPYGVSKMAFESYLFSRRVTHNLSYVALRYGNVFGPRQTFGEAGVCAIFIHQMLRGEQPTIFGDGQSERDYCFVSDVAAANLAALSPVAQGPFNIGTGVGTTVTTVFKVVQAATGYRGEPRYEAERPGEIERIVLNFDRARRELNWQPRVAFSDGIAKTVASSRP